MNRNELLSRLVDVYMDNLLDNPEVVRVALENYFDGFNNDILTKTLAGFGEIAMTREQMVERLIDSDIADIRQGVYTDDNSFLYAVLSGEGWIPYNQLSDEAVEREYLGNEFNEENENG